jgi:hypothetical protein
MILTQAAQGLQETPQLVEQISKHRKSIDSTFEDIGDVITLNTAGPYPLIEKSRHRHKHKHAHKSQKAHEHELSSALMAVAAGAAGTVRTAGVVATSLAHEPLFRAPARTYHPPHPYLYSFQEISGLYDSGNEDDLS